jgi:hypothetical protein
MLASLTPEVRAAYAQGFAASLATVFVVATAVSLIGFVLTWLLPERPLRATLAAEGSEKVGEAFAMPVTPDSLAELRRGLATLANRDAQRGYIQQILNESRVELTPAAAWMLVRLEEQPGMDPTDLASAHAIDAALIANAIDELTSRALIEADGSTVTGARRFGVTPAGCEILGRIIDVRRGHLARAAAEWGATEQNTATLGAIERELVPDAHPSRLTSSS